VAGSAHGHQLFFVEEIVAAAPECIVGRRGNYFCLETKEFLTQRIFVFLLRGLHLAANFVFRKMRPLPFVDLRYRMID
jgi:hypothetical protein